MLSNFKNAKSIPAWLLALALVATNGCENSAPSDTNTATVSGTVTLDGEPVDGAAVVFIPVNLRDNDNEVLNLAYGVTNQKGNFQLTYSDNSPDIIGAKYNILITKSNSANDNQTAATPWPLALLPDSIAKFSTFNESDELIPENYNVNSELFFEFSGSQETVDKKLNLSTIDPSLK
ncbi:hypothetical protein N9B54_02885 [Mariniblastus sp.]|mgnify:FL=1|jgi:hypothetical protein|nr:hypothetical protein [Mariniblastus sp.]MDA7879894.1 hypothetical protein [Mariniblastus sp.]MDA7906697.1 hypothetical protein [Mariniblastus sp.]MDA7925729.1 hypothetical protein [Mariniblastus sp.]MDA7928884.1 hypothetical protein [Mariniblastus sp.]